MSSTGLRFDVGQTLAKIDEDWTVAYATDAVGDPGFLIVWGPDLWRAPDSFGVDTAALEVIVFAARLDAETAQLTLEEMVDAAVPVLLDAGYRHQGVTPPAPLDVGGVTYLTARIRIHAPLPTRT